MRTERRVAGWVAGVAGIVTNMVIMDHETEHSRYVKRTSKDMTSNTGSDSRGFQWDFSDGIFLMDFLYRLKDSDR